MYITLQSTTATAAQCLIYKCRSLFDRNVGPGLSPLLYFLFTICCPEGPEIFFLNVGPQIYGAMFGRRVNTPTSGRAAAAAVLAILTTHGLSRKL